MSFFKQDYQFIKQSFPEFSQEEYDLLRKCTYMLTHKCVQPHFYIQQAIQYLCSIILQHENLHELEKESNEA